jgi:hypothetical protein
MKKAILFSFLILLLFSCEEEEDPFLAYDTPYEEYGTLSRDATGIREAFIKTVNGDLSANPSIDTLIFAEIIRTCWGKDLEDARAHIADIEIIDQVSTGGDKFSLEAIMSSGGPWGYATSFDVDLPDSVVVVLSNANGNIMVNSRKSDAYCSSVNGNIAVMHHQGNLNVLITNGSIYAGTLMLDSAHVIELGATSGDIMVVLPAGQSASFDAGTTFGLVNVEGFANVEYQVDTPTRKIGRIGNGGASIKVITVNGDIDILAN